MRFKGLCRVLLLIFSTLFVTTPVMALPILFTDRTAFTTAVGTHTILTFDTFQPLEPIGSFGSDFGATYAGLFEVGGDITGAATVYSNPGAITLTPNSGFGAGTAVPVQAFGFDFTPQCFGSCSSMSILVGSYSISFNTPQFIGLLFSEPTEVGISVIGQNFGKALIDNVRIQAVPEPSSLFFMSAVLICLVGWHMLLRKSVHD